MFINCNFNLEVQNVVCYSKPLCDWFMKNQDTMAYFELTHAGCTHFENSSMAHTDIKILGKMANAALTWIENKNYPYNVRAEQATIRIAEIYEEYKDVLSEVAQELYSIDYELENIDEIDESHVVTRVLTKHNGTKNNRPGKGHRKH